jgi:hypothetical protein
MSQAEVRSGRRVGSERDTRLNLNLPRVIRLGLVTGDLAEAGSGGLLQAVGLLKNCG